MYPVKFLHVSTKIFSSTRPFNVECFHSIQFNSIQYNTSHPTNSTMAPTTKRPREEDTTSRSTTKKPRHGFKVGPDNLPDGTWRRKVISIKKDLIHKAKVKKSYAKLRAREPLKEERNLYAEDEEKKDEVGNNEEGEESAQGEAVEELHPQRKAMLDEPEPDTAVKSVPRYSNTNKSEDSSDKKRDRGDKRGAKPAYFAKELAFAEKQKAEQKARREEFERREREKKAKIEERERFRRQMAKARSGGKNGQRKLGRESQVLLEKVKRVVGN